MNGTIRLYVKEPYFEKLREIALRCGGESECENPGYVRFYNEVDMRAFRWNVRRHALPVDVKVTCWIRKYTHSYYDANIIDAEYRDRRNIIARVYRQVRTIARRIIETEYIDHAVVDGEDIQFCTFPSDDDDEVGHAWVGTIVHAADEILSRHFQENVPTYLRWKRYGPREYEVVVKTIEQWESTHASERI